jgi:glycosyltransferase involved in cell wall biosynthesis
VTRRPRLLCVYQHAPTPGAPGIYRHRMYFAELVRRGFAVDLVSTPINYMTGEVPPRYRRRPFLHESIDGIDHHWVWASRGIHASKVRRALNYASFAADAAARSLTLPRPDVVMVSSPPLPVGMLGPVLARRFRAPWLLEVRDIWPESAASVGWLSEDSAAYRALERIAHRLASTASAVIVPTPGLEPEARRHGARAVEVVPGPVVDARIDDAERADARRALDVDDDRCVFVYAGAVGVANGLDVLLDAVRAVPDDVRFSVLVAGDGSAREPLERRVASERIERVRVLGAVPKDEVRTLLAAADVCLHLLRADPVFQTAQPTKMLEYFGAHRPVITTVPGRPRELALESGGGFAPDAPSLAAEIERWARLDAGERRRLGDAAFAYGDARFGLAAAADGLEALLRRLT